MKPDRKFTRLLSKGKTPKWEAENAAIDLGWNPYSKPIESKGYTDRHEGNRYYFYFSKNLQILEVTIVDDTLSDQFSLLPKPKAEQVQTEAKQQTIF